MNLVELLENAKKVAAWRGTGYSQNEGWTITNAVPYMGTKSILYQLVCNGQTETVQHVVNLQFTGLKILDEPLENVDMMELEYKDVKYYCEFPTVKSQVKTRCSCSDYTFTFSYWNYLNKCQFGGPPKKYKRKTKNRKPRNPDHLPGICKHIFSANSYLRVHKLMK